MIKLLILVSVMVVLFFVLPVKAAATYSVILALLIFAVLFDASRKGRRLLARHAAHRSDPSGGTRDDSFYTIMVAGLLYADRPGSDARSGGEGVGVGGGHHGGGVAGDFGGDVGDFGGGG